MAVERIGKTMTNYVSVDEALKINSLVLGTQSALRDRGLLESALARPQASAFGEDAYPTRLEKAAAMFHSLVLNHPFVDGNKRTATLALEYFLNENGLKKNWVKEEALEFIVEVAEGKHEPPAIAAWLAENTEAKP